MTTRSNKGIGALPQISLVIGVFTAGMMRAPAFAQTSQVDNADWPLRHAGGAVEIGYAGKAEST